MSRHVLTVLAIAVIIAPLFSQGGPKKNLSRASRRSARLQAHTADPTLSEGHFGPDPDSVLVHNGEPESVPFYTHFAPHPMIIEEKLFGTKIQVDDTAAGKKRLRRNSLKKLRYLDGILQQNSKQAPPEWQKGKFTQEDIEDQTKLAHLLSYRFTDAKLARRFMIMLGLEDRTDDVYRRFGLTTEQIDEVSRLLDERRIGLGEYAKDGRYISKESRDSRERLLTERDKLLNPLYRSKDIDFETRMAEVKRLEEELQKDRRKWTNQRRHIRDRIVYEEKRDAHSLVLANALLNKANDFLNRKISMWPAFKDIDRLAKLLSTLPLGQRCSMVTGTTERLEWFKAKHTKRPKVSDENQED